MGIDGVDNLKPGEGNDEDLTEVPQPAYVENVDGSGSVEDDLEPDAVDAAHLEDTADPVQLPNIFNGDPDEDPEGKELTDDLTKVARQVLDGKWGVGQMRRMALEDAGYNPQEVEEAVKRLLNPQGDNPDAPVG